MILVHAGRFMPRRHRIRLLWLATILALLAPPVCARFNLPHIFREIVITGAAHEKLRQYFATNPRPQVLPAEIEGVLIESLAPAYRAGCRELISVWGEEARDTARETLRLLYAAETGGAAPQLALAYHCFSTQPHDRQDFDERLAWLMVGEKESKLLLFPHAEDAENDSELSRIEFVGLERVPDGTAARFRVVTTNENPCCDGGDTFRGELELWYAVGTSSPRPLIQLELRREQYGHLDAPEEEYEIISKTQVRPERDSTGAVRAFLTETITTESVTTQTTPKTTRPTKKSTTIYRWDAPTRTFARAAR